MRGKKFGKGITLLADLTALAMVLLAFFLIARKPLSKSDQNYIQTLDAAVTGTLMNSRAETVSECLAAEAEQLAPCAPEHLRDRHLKDLAEQYRANLITLQSLLVINPETGEAEYTDGLAWHEALTARGELLQAFCTDFSLFSDRPELVQSVSDATVRERALAAAEDDLRSQLLGASPHRLSRNAPYYLQYRNRTDYTLDLVFVNLYQAPDGRRSCDIQNAVLAPNDRLHIRLDNMPDNCAAWVTDWEIDSVYSDASPLLETY